MKKRIIRVGFDFDGVIAYNPFRVIRLPVSLVKRHFFGEKKLHFWYPEKKWQQIFWILLHESSVFPARGISLLKKLIESEVIEAHLITARYSFLDHQLYRWLNRNKLRKSFNTINLNTKDEQPHLFKERLLKKHRLDFFIEDNLDIVKHLHKKNSTRIFWIYNILDRNYPHIAGCLSPSFADNFFRSSHR